MKKPIATVKAEGWMNLHCPRLSQQQRVDICIRTNSLRLALSSLTSRIPEPRKCPRNSQRTSPARPGTINPACSSPRASSCARLPQLIGTAKLSCVVKLMKKARQKRKQHVVVSGWGLVMSSQQGEL
ncbi:Orotate phosphoribosyltransferase [Clarias magur]|uniref:Orotate phosphoribosyltransferase n=1 Tax=Clarias magur TaxID=1594786 RepID=A0A8J4UV22_CLAMG|nr:Orotate phosphoribosyltransferase [Clarias magur]